jgi:biotin synthase
MACDGHQAALHERALAATLALFDRRVFVRAVVELSNFCRDNCHYCGMRRDNCMPSRAGARHDGLAELLIQHRPKAVTDVKIQSGEDPVAAREVVLPPVHMLRRETGLGFSACLGTLDRRVYSEPKAAGASVYILKFETADARHSARKEAPGCLNERPEHIRPLLASGWKVTSGFIVGLPGHDVPALLACYRMAGELLAHGRSVSPFVPGESTPSASAAPGDIETTLNFMAMLRLTQLDWVIPAVSALNPGQTGCGYWRGLCAGANMVIINLIPHNLQQDYIFYERDRFIMGEERLLTAIIAEKLIPSSQSLAEYCRQGTKPSGAEQAASMAK